MELRNDERAAARLLLSVVHANMTDELREALSEPGYFYDGWTGDGKIKLDGHELGIGPVFRAATRLLVGTMTPNQVAECLQLLAREDTNHA